VYAAAAHVATPLLTLCAAQPLIVVPASVNATVPLAALELIVAVYVTACPTVEGLTGDDVTVVVDDALLTVCVNVTDVDVK
jgi:predicted small secreted protein